jgi:hypothetical protein
VRTQNAGNSSFQLDGAIKITGHVMTGNRFEIDPLNDIISSVDLSMNDGIQIGFRPLRHQSITDSQLRSHLLGDLLPLLLRARRRPGVIRKRGSWVAPLVLLLASGAIIMGALMRAGGLHAA